MYRKGLSYDHLFNKVSCSMCHFNNNIDSTSYTDDKMTCCVGKSRDKVITKLEQSSRIILSVKTKT